jgi:hypothetical protein
MNRNRRPLHVASALILLTLTLLTTACGKPTAGFDPEEVINGSCEAASDQRHSFMAKVPGFPIRVMVDSSFSRVQILSVQQAASRWNGLGRKLIGTDFFDVRAMDLPPAAISSDPTNCEQAYGDKDTLTVVNIHTDSRWREMKLSNDVPGVTLRCFNGKNVTRQSVLLYTALINDVQFGSIITHELGHALGLDHSCANGAAGDKIEDKWISCDNVPSGHPYHDAVMFPTLSTNGNDGMPEVKENLRANDVTRASCLYP